MINFLLFLSITLHLIAFLFIVLLYLRQNKLMNMESAQAKNLEEMEDIITSFIEQMKEENEEFIEKLTRAKTVVLDESTTTEASKKDIPTVMEEKVDLDKELEWKPKGVNTNKALLKNYTSSLNKINSIPNEIEREDIEELLNLILPAEKVELELEEEVEEVKEIEKEKTLLEEALELKEEGKSIEEIARKLNKGKTEIELLLKFRQI